jgi:PAS domain-containing protein
LGNAFHYAAQQLQKLYDDLRQSERELRGVINTVPAHVWSASPDGTVDFINERLLEFVGLWQRHGSNEEPAMLRVRAAAVRRSPSVARYSALQANQQQTWHGHRNEVRISSSISICRR